MFNMAHILSLSLKYFYFEQNGHNFKMNMQVLKTRQMYEKHVNTLAFFLCSQKIHKSSFSANFKKTHPNIIIYFFWTGNIKHTSRKNIIFVI